MLLIPFGTDVPQRRAPLVNYLLIVANAGVFFRTLGPAAKEAVNAYALWAPSSGLFRMHQLVTYAFLHGGYVHLIGNMIMLWVFGASMNARMGHVGYLVFYLGAAAVSGLGHILTSGSGLPCVGASGAICAVTAGFLILYPVNRVKVFAWILIAAGVFYARSLFIIGIWFFLDLVMSLHGVDTNVAYSAHLAGYGMGGVVALLLIATGLLKREGVDIITLFSGRMPDGTRRRVELVSPDTKRRLFGRARRHGRALADGMNAELAEADLIHAVSIGDAQSALRLYEQDLAGHPGTAPPLRILVTVGNWYLRAGRHADAVAAWQRAVAQHPGHQTIPSILFSSGMVLSRHLGRPGEAIAQLTAALPGLDDPDRAQTARAEIARLRGGPRGRG